MQKVGQRWFTVERPFFGGVAYRRAGLTLQVVLKSTLHQTTIAVFKEGLSFEVPNSEFWATKSLVYCSFPALRNSGLHIFASHDLEGSS